jgi:hypothetical protein
LATGFATGFAIGADFLTGEAAGLRATGLFGAGLLAAGFLPEGRDAFLETGFFGAGLRAAGRAGFLAGALRATRFTGLRPDLRAACFAAGFAVLRMGFLAIGILMSAPAGGTGGGSGGTGVPLKVGAAGENLKI